MKIQHRFSIEADRASERYDNVVQGLRGVYLAAVTDRELGSARQMIQVRDAAQAIIRSYLDAEEKLAAAALDAIVLKAQGSTFDALAIPVADETPDALSELADATLDYLMQEISLQAYRDVATTIEAVRRAALDAELSKRSRGVASPSMQAEPIFHFRDRRAFKVKSRVFIRQTWRLALLSLYNETVLLTLADHRHDFAQIEHLDKKAPPHGLIVALGPHVEHPTYAEIRVDVFHPNSDAIIKPLEL